MQNWKHIFLNDHFILVLVLANVVSIFLGGFYDNSFWFALIDSFFTIAFACEAVIKIKSSSFNEYWKDSWNRFDFVVTVLAIPSLLNLFFVGAIPTNILLSFRVMRVFKTFRLFHFIPNINTVLKGILLACKASIFVALGFVALLFVVSMMSSAFFSQYAPEYFGDPASSLYSTFRLFSIEGWYEIPDLIASRSQAGMSAFAKMYFSLVLFVGGILGLSLINAIFVDAAVSDNNDELKDHVIELEKKIDILNEKLDKLTSQNDK